MCNLIEIKLLLTITSPLMKPIFQDFGSFQGHSIAGCLTSATTV